MLRKITMTAVLAGAVALAGCNTVRGAKADVHSAGEAVANSTDGK